MAYFKVLSVWVAFGCLAAICAAQAPTPSVGNRESLDSFMYPLAPSIETPPVVVDSTDLPEAAPWGEAAKKLVEQWFPVICRLLSTENFKPPTEVRLVLKKTLSAPAYTVNNTISIDGEWIAKHPNDLGMVIHELTHVIQHYPRSRTKPGWMVEGIADFIRWWRYEPSPFSIHLGPNATYHDSYRTSAAFFAWVSEHYDQRLVPMLDLAMRNGEDPMPVFQKLTGKSPEDLWAEMISKQR